MTNIITATSDAATFTTVEDLISYAIDATSDAGVSFLATDAAELLAGIDDPEQAAAELRELARLIELHGKTNSVPEAA